MAETSNYISETTIIPRDSVERVLPLQSPGAAPLRLAQIVAAGLSDLTPGYEIVRDKSALHVLEYTLAGRARFRDSAADTSLESGILLLCPAGTRYRYWVEKGHWKSMWFCLSNHGPWRTLAGQAPQVRPAGVPDELTRAMEGFLAESLRRERGADRLSRLFAEQIVAYLERELLGARLSARERSMARHLEALWDEVNRSLDGDWNVAALAARLNMSPSNCHRVVLRHAGRSPSQMVHELRMRRAQEWLIRHDLPIKAVAAQLGYSTPFAFSKAFKRYAGVSPAQYGNQHGSEPEERPAPDGEP